MDKENLGSPRRIYIIGSGTAGLSAAKAARAQDPEAEITMVSADSRLPYYRLRLCEYIGQEIDYGKLEINKQEWFEDNRINLIFSSKVTDLDAKAKEFTANGKEYSFDSLVVATGSSPIMPPFKGKELLAVHTLWTSEDVAGINTSLVDAKKAVVIGGGLLGLETAHKISAMGIDVTLIEGMPRLLPKQLDEDGSRIFNDKVQSLGISVVCGKSVSGFEGDSNGRVARVRMADDTLFDADIVVVTVGVAPNTAICHDSGINIERFLSVNEKMETSVKDIYAAGDVACFNGRWFGQWAVAGAQGLVAGTNAAGGNTEYKITDIPYVLVSMGTRVICSGDIGVPQPDQSGAIYDINQIMDLEQFSYSRLVFCEGIFVGYVLIGEPAKGFNKLQSLVQTSASAADLNGLLYP